MYNVFVTITSKSQINFSTNKTTSQRKYQFVKSTSTNELRILSVLQTKLAAFISFCFVW